MTDFNKLLGSAIRLSVLFIATTVSSLGAKPPNIVVFLADDLGFGDLECYGSPIIQTPHLDALATAGVRLTDCHSGGTPSRTSGRTERPPGQKPGIIVVG